MGKFALEHWQRQRRELYGPLDCLLRRARHLHSTYVKIVTTDRNGLTNLMILIGEDGKPHPERLEDQKLKIWHFFTDRYFIPINSLIRKLIESNYDLIDSGGLPQSYIKFFDHEAQYQALRRLEKHEGIIIPNERVEDHPWPKEFDHEVGETLRKLDEKVKKNRKWSPLGL